MSNLLDVETIAASCGRIDFYEGRLDSFDDL